MIPRRHLVHAHVTAHANTLLGFTALAAPRGTRRNRTRRAVFTFGTVTGWLTTEVMSLHDTGKTFTFAGPDHIHELHTIKNPNTDNIAGFLVGCILKTDFTEMSV